jgi:hypothetical protein
MVTTSNIIKKKGSNEFHKFSDICNMKREEKIILIPCGKLYFKKVRSKININL